MNASKLLRIFGFPATLTFGDCAALDRWLWLRSRLPRTRNRERLLDVGCGSGAFTIGAALRGYDALGLTWDEADTRKALDRATTCHAAKASFRVMDARKLDTAPDLREAFDVVLCCEVIEHILDDRKLFRDLAGCLKPGGRLLLTTPWYHFPPQSNGEIGPYQDQEYGWHVRRGYTACMLRELCSKSGLMIEDIAFCSGFLSQKLSMTLWRLQKFNKVFAWAAVLPFRLLPPLLDPWIHRIFGWRHYSITLDAQMPRFGDAAGTRGA